jgi:putative hemolysin
MPIPTPGTLSVFGLLDEPLRSLLRPMEPLIQKLFRIDQLRQLFEIARRSGGEGAVVRLLKLIGVEYCCAEEEFERIPRSGPVVLVANHPFGLLDGAVLAALLPRVRPDCRLLANSILAGVPELRDQCIFVNPFGQADSVGENAAALRECLTWLRRGGLLACFPAGEVAHLDFRNRSLVDPPWNPVISRLAVLARATTVPVFFRGSNSLTFQLAGVIHPRLRTAGLPGELLNKAGQRIKVRVGRPVPHPVLRALPGNREAIEYLRWRTYLLDTEEENGNAPVRLFPPTLPSFRQPARIVAPQPRNRLADEVARLGRDRKLCEAGELAVYIGSAAELPNVLPEIGRLREIAFRQAGEGTGKPIDLDRFDRHYLHLFLWNHSRQEVAGAYRLGTTPEILTKYGICGLYTSTLFRFHKSLFDRLGPAVELGRSFIRPEYQKQYAPLLLLWKGIAQFVARRPDCAALFGGVSISRRYHAASRYLLVRFLETRRAHELAGMVAPRCPYRPSGRVLRSSGRMPHVSEDIEDLSELIAELEHDGKGVPVLVKQYLKTGGRLLAVTVDHSFCDALDALIVVDLRNAPAPLLERFVGKQAAAAYRTWHSTSQGAA